MEAPYVTPTDPLVAELVERLDASLREDFDERAGIMQFDGGLTRGHAEALAMLDLLCRQPSFFGGWFNKKEPHANDEATRQGNSNTRTDQAAEPNAASQNNGDKPGFIDKLNLKQRLEAFKQSAENAVEHVIKLMVVFTLDTIILPIFLIWTLVGIGRSIVLSTSEPEKALPER